MRVFLSLATLFSAAVAGAGCGGVGVSAGDAAVDGPGMSAGDAAVSDGDPGGELCGGIAGLVCPASQYCDYDFNRCGVADEPGRCRLLPGSCPPLPVPERTCGCDGVVYPSLCDVVLAGSDLNGAGTCTVEPGAFVCGYRQCARATQYCERTASGSVHLPDEFTCRELPSGCGSTPSCACLTGQPCGDRCAGDAAAGLTLTCASN